VKWGKGLFSRLKNSKVGKAAGAVKAKAKAAYQQGKAWAKKKVEAGKNWVKGKAGALKAGLKSILDVNESFGEGEDRHTIKNEPGSNELVVYSDPIVLRYHSHRPIRALARLYKKTLDGGSPSAMAIAKSILVKVKKMAETFESSHKGPGHGAKDVGLSAAHAAQPKGRASGKWKELYLQSEHVIPRSWISHGFSFLAGSDPVTDTEYNSMTTILLYQRASKSKDLPDIGGARKFRKVAGTGSAVGSIEAKAKVEKYLGGAMRWAVAQTMNHIVQEHAANGRRRKEDTARPGDTNVLAAAKAQKQQAMLMLKERLG